MLNSGKKIALCATKTMNILTLVFSEKKILNETKNHKPLLQVKWSVPNTSCKYSLEWVIDSCLAPIFQLYHGKNRLIFNDMMMIMTRSALYYTNMLSWILYSAGSLKQQTWIDMSPHSDTLSWYRANPSLLFLLNAVWLAEKQQIPIL